MSEHEENWNKAYKKGDEILKDLENRFQHPNIGDHDAGRAIFAEYDKTPPGPASQSPSRLKPLESFNLPHGNIFQTFQITRTEKPSPNYFQQLSNAGVGIVLVIQVDRDKTDLSWSDATFYSWEKFTNTQAGHPVPPITHIAIDSINVEQTKSVINEAYDRAGHDTPDLKTWDRVTDNVIFTALLGTTSASGTGWMLKDHLNALHRYRIVSISTYRDPFDTHHYMCINLGP